MANYKLRFFTKSRENDDELAKKYYFSELPTNKFNFRNYWKCWEDIPNEYEVEQYPEDYLGNKTPKNGDYLIVYNSDDYNGRISGIWEFTYHGIWETSGKDGWKPTKEIEKESVPKYTAGKYTCKLYQPKVSVGLIESNTVVVFGEDSDGKIKALSNISEYQAKIDDGWKILLYINTNEQNNLMFYSVDQQTEEIAWKKSILLDPKDYSRDSSLDASTDVSVGSPLSFNLGFIGDKEGAYENAVYICEVKTSKTKAEELTGSEEIIHAGTMTVFSHAIGEDERYRTLFENFGLPDPISYMEVFKDETVEEKNKLKYDDKIDYEQLNKKSKQLFLSYSEIFPYVGTYKALINAVDFLGYDDIYFKEWYKIISDTPGLKPTLTAYNISYKNENGNSIEGLPIEQRVQLKKMNWLSMIYKITEEYKNENGDIEYEVLPDNVCFPLIRENYSIYDAEEILIKLFALKRWLEKNIIALNCRIIEIGGEGITFERYKYRIYGTRSYGTELYEEKSVTPYLRKDEETGGIYKLKDSGADIKVGIKELKDPEFIETTRDITVRAMMSSSNSILKKYDVNGYVKDKNESISSFKVLNKTTGKYEEKKNTLPEDGSAQVSADDFATDQINHLEVRLIFSPASHKITKLQEQVLSSESYSTNTAAQYFNFEYKKYYPTTKGEKEKQVLSTDFIDLVFVTNNGVDAAIVRYNLNGLSKKLENGKTYTLSFIFNAIRDLITSEIKYYETKEVDVIESDKISTDIGIVSVPILIQDGEIFFDPKLLYKGANDCESIFYKNPVIQIEKANLRRQGITWSDNIVYSMTNDGPTSAPYVLTNMLTQDVYYKKDYITLRAYNQGGIHYSLLKYTAKNSIGVPLFIIHGFQDYILGKDIIEGDEDFILEIMDGKMIFTGEYLDQYGEKVTRTTYLNFHYDTEASEQSIEVNYVYEKTANTKDLIGDDGEAKLITINVKNIGTYKIYAFAQDEHNNIFGARCVDDAIVESPTPEIELYTRFARDFNDVEKEIFYPSQKDSEDTIIWGNESTKLADQKILPYKIYDDGNKSCILKEQYLINNLTVVRNVNDDAIVRYVKYPTISYAYDTPKEGYRAHLMNISDKFELAHSYSDLASQKTTVYLRRIGDFEANTLNTIGKENHESIALTNIVIYDNVHAEPLYQEEVKTIWTNQVQEGVDASGNPIYKTYNEYFLTFQINSNTLREFFVYYYSLSDDPKEAGNTLLPTQYFVDEKVDEPEKVVGNMKNVTTGEMEEIPEEDEQVNVQYALAFNKLFTTYAQATYTIADARLNEDGTVTISSSITDERGTYIPLFKERQVVKLISVLTTTVNNENDKKLETYQIASRIKHVVINGQSQTYSFEDDAPMLSPKSDDYNVAMFLAHAHQAFVDYEFDVDHSLEKIDSDGLNIMNFTEVYLKNDRNLDFVDDTFSISSRNFNVHNAYDYWSDDTFKDDGDDNMYPTICCSHTGKPMYPKEQPYGKETVLYKHTDPVTLEVNEDIMIYGSRVELMGSKNYNYWRVRKYNPETAKNELLMESWNDILMLTPGETGLYSIELFVYDDYGNLTSVAQNGLFKVIESKEETAD